MVRTSCSGTAVLTYPNMKFSLPVLTKTENLLKLDLEVAALTFLPEVLTSPVLAMICWEAAGWRNWPPTWCPPGPVPAWELSSSKSESQSSWNYIISCVNLSVSQISTIST